MNIRKSQILDRRIDGSQSDSPSTPLKSYRSIQDTGQMDVLPMCRKDTDTVNCEDTPPVDPEPQSVLLQLCCLWKEKSASLLLFCMANAGVGLGDSLYAPLFPREAARKGISPSIVGFVFASYSVAMLVGAPLFGSMLTAIGPRFMYVSGMLVYGSCSVLFGCLDSGTYGLSFIVLCFLIRILQGFAVKSFNISSQALKIEAFPGNLGSVFAARQVSRSLGFVIGLSTGGILYELEGFGFPFWVVGSFNISIGIISIFIIVSPQARSEHKNINKNATSMFDLLKSSRVCTSLLITASGSSALGFLQPTLSTHLEIFGLSPVLIGLGFVLISGISMITSPLVGFLSDRESTTNVIVVAGPIIGAISMALLDAVPRLFLFKSNISSICASLVLFGLTQSICNVSTISPIVKGAKELGFSDTLETFGVATGLFHAIHTLSSVIGTSVSGLMVDGIGFGNSATCISGMFVTVCITWLCLSYLHICTIIQ